MRRASATTHYERAHAEESQMNATYSTAFVPAISGECEGRPARWFVFHEGKMLVAAAGDAVLLPICTHLTELGLEPTRIQFLGMLHGEPAYAAELTAPNTPEG